MEPSDHYINWQQDPFANYQGRFVFEKKAREFKITVDLVVEMAVYNPFDFFLEPDAEEFPFRYEAQLQKLLPYLMAGERTELVNDYLASIDYTKRRTVNFLVDLNTKVHNAIKYTIRMEPGVQTPEEETLTLGSGSCRDSAWLLVQLLRHCGLAARFVSGYLIQLKPDVKSLDGPSGTEVEFHRLACLV